MAGLLGWLRRALGALGGAPSARERIDAMADEADEPPTGPDGVVALPLEDALDLHHFAPRDVPSVVDEYLRAAHEAGMDEVTIIHGRGKGVQRRIVHQILERHPAVASFGPAAGARATGATLARLAPRPGR